MWICHILSLYFSGPSMDYQRQNGYEHLTPVDFLAKKKICRIRLLFTSRQLGRGPLTCEINNHNAPLPTDTSLAI